MKVDLHIHSMYSDSSRSPEEIVALAKKRNVGLLSISFILLEHSNLRFYFQFSAHQARQKSVTLFHKATICRIKFVDCVKHWFND